MGKYWDAYHSYRIGKGYHCIFCTNYGTVQMFDFYLQDYERGEYNLIKISKEHMVGWRLLPLIASATAIH